MNMFSKAYDTRWGNTMLMVRPMFPETIDIVSHTSKLVDEEEYQSYTAAVSMPSQVARELAKWILENTKESS